MPRSSERYQILSAYNDRVCLEFPNALLELTGTGHPDVLTHTVSAPMQHGQTYLGGILTARTLQVSMRLFGKDRIDLRDKRRKLCETLSPLVSPLSFRAMFEDGWRVRLRDVSFQGPFEGPVHRDGDALSQAIAFRLTAHDPLWWSELESQATVTRVAAAQLVFPIQFGYAGIFFGSNVQEATIDVTNVGDWETYPTIEVTGPCEYLLIHNVTLDLSFQYRHSISPGSTVTFDTFRKVVFDTDGATDLIRYVDEQDYARFVLAPAPVVAGGVNRIMVFSAAIGITNQVTLRWYNKYLAI